MRLLLLALIFASPLMAQSPKVLDLGSASQHINACPPNNGSGSTSAGTTWANYGFGTVCTSSSYIEDWSSGAILSTQKLFVMGGSGHTHYNSEIYGLNYHPGLVGWTRLNTSGVFCPNGGGLTGGISPDCRSNGLSPNFCGMFSSNGDTGCIFPDAK